MTPTTATRDIEKAWAQGRLGELHPVSVIDIGSNSVRQVIYEGHSRVPTVLFNEKVLCGLGKGVATTGKLDEEAISRALAAVTRFKALSQQAAVERTHILATAAARDASNGPQFISAVEEIMEEPVELLTGKKEAEYSAHGVLCGFHSPDGIAGDMGGGSLELIGVGNGLSLGVTTPLGGLRLQEVSNNNLAKAQEIAKQELSKTEVQWPGTSRSFYAIGGTWRALARLHMEVNNYPIGIIHHYEISGDDMRHFCQKIVKGDFDKALEASRISKNRLQLLPFGAVVMEEVLEYLQADSVVMSSLGVREGYLHSKLSQEERDKDALIEASKELAILRARSPRHSRELSDWTQKAFEVLNLGETENERRFRRAACFLADIAWRAHNDFRADQSLATISNAGFVSITHEGRAYIALANFHRYQGLSPKVLPPMIADIASKRTVERARILAGMFRILYLFSASMEGVVPQLGFTKIEKGKFGFLVPERLSHLIGERPLNRIAHLAREIDAEIEVQIV